MRGQLLGDLITAVIAAMTVTRTRTHKRKVVVSGPGGRT